MYIIMIIRIPYRHAGGRCCYDFVIGVSCDMDIEGPE